MAGTGDTSTDLRAHERTWHGFKTMMTWGAIACFLAAGFVILMIAN